MNYSQFFTAKELNFIRDEMRIAETERHFTPDLLQLIYNKEWFRTTIPLYCNGLEWEIPKIIELFESLAYADGSLGWAINLGSGANLFSGFLESPVAKAIYTDTETCCAGSGAITGTALPHGEDFLISGYWKYASGSAHATHFTGNAYICDLQGEPILNETGEKKFISFIVPREKVEIKDSWNAMGLRASSSHDFQLSSILVERSHIFSLIEPSLFSPSPLYQFPFIPFSVVSLASMSIGITYHFIELFEANILTKKPLYMDHTLADESNLIKQFQKLTKPFYAERLEMHQHLKTAWDELITQGSIRPKTETRLIDSARKSADLAFHLVSELYRYCGMSIIFMDSQLNKVFRDLYVASQHFMISPIHQYS